MLNTWISGPPVPRLLLKWAPLLLAGLVLVAGCAKTPDDPAAVYAEGQAALDQGKLRAAMVHLKKAVRLAPQNADYRALLGRIHELAGDAPSAEKEFRVISQQQPDNPRFRFGLAQSLKDQGKYDEAMALLPADAQDVETLLLRSEILAGQNEVAKAQAGFNSVLAQDPSNADAYRGLAVLAQAAGEADAAADLVEKALVANPDDSRSWLMKGTMNSESEHYDVAIDALRKAVQTEPYDVSREQLLANAYLALAYLGKRDATAAEQPLAVIAGINKGSAWYHYISGLIHLEKGEVNEARSALRNVLLKSPYHVRSLAALGKLELDAGNVNVAKEHLMLAAKHGAGSPSVYKTLAYIHLLQKEYQDAVDVLRPLVKALPGDSESWALLGTVNLEAGQLEQAVENLSRAVALDPDNADYRKKLARSYLVKGDTGSSADELIRNIQDRPDAYDSEYLLAVTFLKEKNYSRAMDIAEKLSSRLPGSAIPQILMGAISQDQGDLGSARAYYQRALELEPNQPRAAINLIKLDLLERNIGSAEALLEQQLTANPDQVEALALLGTIRFSAGDDQEAVRLWNRARELDPAEVDSRLYLANYYLAIGNDAQSALVPAREIVAANPYNSSGLLLLSQVQLRLGQLQDALSSARKYADLTNQSALARYQLALVYGRLGDIDVARSHLQAALASDPQFADARLLLSEISFNSGTGDDTSLRRDEQGKLAASSQTDVFILARRLLQEGQGAKALELARQLADKSPGQINPLLLLGGIQRAQGELGDARASFRKVLDIEADNVAATLNLAELDIQEGNQAAARDRYRAILEKNPGNRPTLLKLAAIAPTPEAAVKWLEEALKTDANSVETMILLGSRYLELQRYDEAMGMAQQALARIPNEPRAQRIMLLANKATGRWNQAQDYARRLLDSNPDLDEARFYLADIKASMGDYAGSQEILDELLAKYPDNSDYQLSYALLDARQGRADRAESRVEQVLARDPENVSALGIRGDLLAARGAQSQALALYQKAWDQARSRSALLKLALGKWQTGQRQAAIAVLEAWLQDHPDDIVVGDTLGTYAFFDNNLALAQRQYEQLLEMQPGDTDFLNKQSNIYLQMNQPQKALETARKAYQLEPESPVLADTYGWILVQHGDAREGLEAMRMAVSQLARIENDADRATLRFHLAEAYRRNGDKSSARDELASLLKGDVVFPEREEAELALQRLSQ